MKAYKIYLSGKISGLEYYDFAINFRIAKDEALTNRASLEQAKFLRTGNYKHRKIEVVNPLFIKPLYGIHNWRCHMVADIWELLWCQEIFMLNNWHDSKGAKIEHFVAKLTMKTITYQSNL